jgi:hypothetical protein
MLAASLGRAWAAAHPAGKPIGPAAARPPGPQAPLQPPTVVAHPDQDGSHATGAATSRCSLLVPTAQPPATGAPHAGLAYLVAQRASAAATALTQPGRVRRRHPTDQRATSVASPAVIQASAVDRAARRRGSHRDLDPFPWCRLPRRTHLVPNATA